MDEVERQRLLNEVKRLKTEADIFYGNTNTPTFIAPSFVYKPMSVVSSGANNVLYAQTVANDPKGQPFIEVKVWYPNGEYRVLRGLLQNTSVFDKDGRSKADSIKKNGLGEGDVMTARFSIRAWKRDAGGRPTMEPTKPDTK